MVIVTSSRPLSEDSFRVEGPYIYSGLASGVDREIHGEYYFFAPSILVEDAVYTFRAAACPIVLNGEAICPAGQTVRMRMIRKGSPYVMTVWEVSR
jgi:hypothetical protein